MCPKEALPIDETTWQESGSKFVSKAGKYLAKMQMPSWKQAGRSYKFPFVIEEDGLEKGKQGEGYAAMQRFALEPYFNACGVEYSFENGKLVFEKSDFVNKSFLAVYTEQPDTRSVEEGGTGKTFIKFDHAEPISSNDQELA